MMCSTLPAFTFKAVGPVDKSLEASAAEEIALCRSLINEIRSKASTISKHKDETFWCTHNNRVTSVLQGFKNPVCGLVGLEMAAELLRNFNPSIPTTPTTQILNKALEMGISKKGEIFSAYDMNKLALEIFQCHTTVVENQLSGELGLISQTLMRGFPILVPYDNDRNFSPCLNKGHNAHWALITGFVVGCNTKSASVNFEVVDGDLNLHKITDDNIDFLKYTCLDNFYVYVKQGKSAKSRLWSLTELSKSNSNLLERDPNKNWDLFHCPYDLKLTLANRFVILSP